MRVISQHGNVDFNYDNATLLLSGSSIYARIGETYEYEVARYSNGKKSHKAMELFRKAYLGLPVIMQNIEMSEDVIEKLKNSNVILGRIDGQPSNIEYLNNGVFQFPLDEEIEV